MAFKVNLPTIYAGVSYRKGFRWYTQNEDGVRSPVDLTGYKGRLQLKDAPGGNVLADWSTDNGMLVFGDTNRIEILLPRAETDKYDFEVAVWDMVYWPEASIEDVQLMMYGEVPYNVS